MFRRCIPVFLSLAGFLILAEPSRAQGNLGPITIGAGLQTSYVHTDADGSNSTDQFQVNHARLYISGPVADGIKFMFNTDYDSVTNKIGVIDAVAEFAISPKFNIWAGRFLPPSDRANGAATTGFTAYLIAIFTFWKRATARFSSSHSPSCAASITSIRFAPTLKFSP